MADDDKLSTILIHVGETRKGIANVEQVLDAMGREVIRRPECTERHIVVANSVAALKEDLQEIRADVKAIRRSTGRDHPAVSASMLVGDGEEKQKGLKYWVTVAVGGITILTFLASIFWGVISAGRYLERVDAIAKKADKQNVELKREIIKASKKSTAYLSHIKRFTEPNDGGTPPTPAPTHR
jgi:hypothetical protein